MKIKPIIAALIVLFIPAMAEAQNGTAPAMYGVNEVIVQFPHFGDDKIAGACGLLHDELADVLKKTLQEETIPAIPAEEAKPPMTGIARINLIPTVYSYNGQGLDCVSWVSLAAESRNRVHVAPVDVARNVTISYWREGSLLMSSQATHEQVVLEALKKLARSFAQQYKIDQPMPVPNQ